MNRSCSQSCVPRAVEAVQSDMIGASVYQVARYADEKFRGKHSMDVSWSGIAQPSI